MGFAGGIEKESEAEKEEMKRIRAVETSTNLNPGRKRTIKSPVNISPVRTIKQSKNAPSYTDVLRNGKLTLR